MRSWLSNVEWISRCGAPHLVRLATNSSHLSCHSRLVHGRACSLAQATTAAVATVSRQPFVVSHRGYASCTTEHGEASPSTTVSGDLDDRKEATVRFSSDSTMLKRLCEDLARLSAGYDADQMQHAADLAFLLHRVAGEHGRGEGEDEATAQSTDMILLQETLSHGDAALLLQHALQAALRCANSETASDRSPRDDCHLNALYAAFRLFSAQAQTELAEVPGQAKREPAQRSNAKRPFSRKGVYYSYAFAQLLYAEREIHSLLSDPALTSTAGDEADEQEQNQLRTRLTTLVLPLVDHALKVLLVDAVADSHASAHRPSSLLLAMAALHVCAACCVCAHSCNRGDTTRVVLRSDVMPFMASAVATWVASRAGADEGASVSSGDDLFAFLRATAASCVATIVAHSPQSEPIQEALWLRDCIDDICAAAASSSSTLKGSPRQPALHSVNLRKNLAMAGTKARLCSPLLQHMHAAVVTTQPSTRIELAQFEDAPSVRLLYAALQLAPEVSLLRLNSREDDEAEEDRDSGGQQNLTHSKVVQETPRYVLLSREEASSGAPSESVLGIERELLRPFLARRAGDGEDEKHDEEGGLDALLRLMEGTHNSGETAAEPTSLLSRQRVLHAVLAPLSARLTLHCPTSQDQQRLDMASGTLTHQQDDGDDEEVVRSSLSSLSSNGSAGYVSLDVFTSLCVCAVQRELFHLERSPHASQVTASHALLSQLSRLFLLIGAYKQQLRGQRRPRRESGHGRRHSAQDAHISLAQVYAVEQAVWFNVLSSIRDGHFTVSSRSSSSLTTRSTDAMVLEKLVLPLYDHRQWRGATVNVFLGVLAQWRLTSQIREVFRVVFQREAPLREAILGRLRQSQNPPDDMETEETRESQPSVATRSTMEEEENLLAPPALTLTSCEAVLAACVSDNKALYPFMAAEVVEYALFRLHWWRLRHQPQDDEGQPSAHDEDHATPLCEGRTLEDWRVWIDDVARPCVLDAFARSGETPPDDWQTSAV